MNQDQAFCNVHQDYVIQMVCLDYSTQNSYRMCKKCNREFNLPGNIEENIINTNQQLQNEFKQIFFTQNSVQEKMNNQIDEYCKEFKNQLTRILMRVPDLFNEIINRLRGPQNEQTIKEYKMFYNTQQMAIKQDINNLIYNQLDEVENKFFSYDKLQNQELFVLPSNEEILSNMDGNNLLRKFEQIFINQYQLFNEEELLEHINRKFQHKERLRNQSQQFRVNTEQIINRIEQSILEQKNLMIARVRSKEQTLQNNQDRLISFLDNFEAEIQQFQIQNGADFYKIIQFEQLPNELEQLAQRQTIAQSRICHVGRIDFQIPLSEIQQKLSINYIPIRRLDNNAFIIPKIEYERIYPNPTQYKEKGLFNLDLSNFFNTNIFNYTITENEIGIKYHEDSQPCKWECTKLRQQDTYSLQLNLEGRGKIDFEDLRVYDNMVNLDTTITVNTLENNMTYTGQVNCKLQYHGSGILTQDNLIKQGQWENGLQHGQGKIEKKVNNQNVIVYEGQFLRGLYHGEGVLTNNNIVKSGQWENGQLHGQGKIERRVEKQITPIYEGNFSQGQFHGQGVLFYRDNYQYHGNFVNGLREGQGSIKQLINNELKDIEQAEWKQDFPISEKCQIF